MATYYFRNVGANWGDAANWSLTSGGTASGAVPTAADDAIFDANSGACTVNTSNRVCKTIDFTNYTNTITMTFGINVSGNITLGSGMGVGGTGFLAFNNVSATYTPNGYEWPNEFRFISVTTSKTYTIAADCSFGGVVSNTGSVGGTLANIFAGGRTITCKAGINNTVGTLMQGVTSFTTFVIAGGTLNGIFTQFTNVTLNSASTITVNSVGMYSTATGGVNPPTFTYTAGTISGTRTLSFGACTLNLGSSVKWTAMTGGGGGLQGSTVLAADLHCEGLYTINMGFLSSGAYNIYTWSYAGTAAVGDPQGSGGGNPPAKLIFNGTGTISYTGGNGWLIEINTTGTVTITTSVLTLNSVNVVGGFNWIQGSVVHSTEMSISRGGGTFNFGEVSWWNVTLGSNISWVTNLILLSDLVVRGRLSISGTITPAIQGPGIVYVDGSLIFGSGGGFTTTNTKVVMRGTGNLVHTTTANVTGQIDINTSGTITFGLFGTTNYPTIYKSGSFNYVKGRLITRGVNLVVQSTSSGWVNMHRVPFDSVLIAGGTTQTMNEFFTGRPGKYCSVTSSGANVNITFTDTFEKFARFCLPSGMTITQRGQLRLLSSKGNRSSTNLGIVSFEGLPYGSAKNNPLTYQSPCYSFSDNPADPNTF